MIGKTISHYKIVEKLGEGGMGVVYKAEDTKLKRTVALKFLPLEWTRDREAKERLVHEAQAASALDHPNICNIHEIGETEDGLVFICMAFYDGETLKKKIEHGPLPLEASIDYVMQVANGLAKAHCQDIVHRDIKPANIMVTEDGLAKIVDFGLAKAAGQTKLTKEGTTLGTIAYMSPEQAQGATVDRRTDIWALGAVLFEMLTGQQPFKGDYEQAVMYSIMNEEPEPITGLRTGVPMELEQMIFKALAKNPEERYQHADELETDLRRIQRTLSTKPERDARAVAKPRRRGWLASPMLWTIFIVLFGLMGGMLLFYPSKTIPFSERDWILITDFVNLTGEDVFEGTLNEAITIDLQQSRYVNVFARKRITESLKRMEKEPGASIDESLGREICLRENIKAMLVGSISRIETVYSVSAKIIDPNTGDLVITARVEAKDKEAVLSALDQLTKRIRKELGESLAAIQEQDKPLAKVTTSSLQALRYYTIGREHSRRAEWEDAIPFYKKAIEEDSTFAYAYTALGTINSSMGKAADAIKFSSMAMKWSEKLTDRERLFVVANYYRDRGELDKAIENYKILVQLYPDSFPGHNNLAFSYQFTRQYEEALEHLQELARLSPNTWYVHHNMGLNYGGLGEVDSALEHFSTALEISPKQYWSNVGLGMAYTANGQFEEAREQFEKLLEQDESWQSIGESWLVILYRYMGKYETALTHLLTGIRIDQMLNKKSSEAWRRLVAADCYLARGEKEAYFREIKMAVEAWPSAWILGSSGTEYARNRMFDWAENVLRRLEALISEEQTNANLAQFYKLKGEIEFAQQNYQESANDFQVSISYDDGLLTRASLARVYVKTGNYEKAIEEHEFIVAHRWATLFDAVSTLWALSHYGLGEIYELKGDTTKAIRYYEKFLNIFKQADEGLQEVIDAKTRMAQLKGMTLK